MTLRNPNSFRQFRELVATNLLEPATSNMYEVRIPPCPAMMQNTPLYFLRDAQQAINFFASSVTVPSRAVTTSEINDFGMMRRFGSGQTNSQINMSFLVTKNNIHRDFFERWCHYVASDSDNTVGFYDDYVTDMEIIKWERGSNLVMSTKVDNKEYKTTMTQATAVYKLYGAFPANISTLTFDNEQTNLLQLDIQFYFERYRFDTINLNTLRYEGPDWDQRQNTLSQPEIEQKAAFSQNSGVGGYGGA